MEGNKMELSHKEKQVADLQDKFLQSSAHIMEETIKSDQGRMSLPDFRVK